MRKLHALGVATKLLLISLISLKAVSQPITTPRTPSPAASVTQTIGISTVAVNYSRPSVKGREIWGKLVPYGWNVQGFGAGNSAPWRAGANENSTIRFSHDAMVEGKSVPAGTSAGTALASAAGSEAGCFMRCSWSVRRRNGGNVFESPGR